MFRLLCNFQMKCNFARCKLLLPFAHAGSIASSLPFFLSLQLPNHLSTYLFVCLCVCAFHFAKSYLSLQNKRQIEITLQLKSLVIEKYNRMPQVQSRNNSSRKHRVIFSETSSSTFIVCTIYISSSSSSSSLLLLHCYCCHSLLTPKVLLVNSRNLIATFGLLQLQRGTRRLSVY